MKPDSKEEIAVSEVIHVEAFERQYDEKGFWEKLLRFGRTAGSELVEKALYLFYTLQRPQTPAWARRVIYGALAYFVLPFDFISDLIPAVGYTDDLGVIVAALGTVALYITPEVKEKARAQTERWFGTKDFSA